MEQEQSQQNTPAIEGVDYIVENGRWVFSEDFLRKRGFCCNSKCRNCPYPKEVNGAGETPPRLD